MMTRIFRKTFEKRIIKVAPYRLTGGLLLIYKIFDCFSRFSKIRSIRSCRCLYCVGYNSSLALLYSTWVIVVQNGRVATEINRVIFSGQKRQRPKLSYGEISGLRSQIKRFENLPVSRVVQTNFTFRVGTGLSFRNCSEKTTTYDAVRFNDEIRVHYHRIRRKFHAVVRPASVRYRETTKQ